MPPVTFLLDRGVVSPTLTTNLDEMIDEAVALVPSFAFAPRFAMINDAGVFRELDQSGSRQALERSIVSAPAGRYELAAMSNLGPLSVRLFKIREPKPKPWIQRYAAPLALGGLALAGVVVGVVASRAKKRSR